MIVTLREQIKGHFPWNVDFDVLETDTGNVFYIGAKIIFGDTRSPFQLTGIHPYINRDFGDYNIGK